MEFEKNIKHYNNYSPENRVIKLFGRKKQLLIFKLFGRMLTIIVHFMQFPDGSPSILSV